MHTLIKCICIHTVAFELIFDAMSRLDSDFKQLPIDKMEKHGFYHRGAR